MRPGTRHSSGAVVSDDQMTGVAAAFKAYVNGCLVGGMLDAVFDSV